MYLDFAPLEGITGVAFRRLYHQYFSGVDRYYTPFFSPTQDHRFTPRELREIDPELNKELNLIPQILTKNASDFVWAVEELSAMGYTQFNLNCGCPSGTVTAKGKGSGMLADISALDRFLSEIFDSCSCSISIKTRLGLSDPDEFGPVLEIYNRYPLSELIIHPRVRKDFYRHPVRIEAFEQALQQSKNPVSYNGSIVAPEDYFRCAEKYPTLTAIMIGQGLASDPFLAGRIKGGVKMDKALLRQFHDELFAAYAEQFQSRNNAASRMKELWFYWLRLFADSKQPGKQIMKSRTAEDYLSAVERIFRELPLLEHSTGDW